MTQLIFVSEDSQPDFSQPASPEGKVDVLPVPRAEFSAAQLPSSNSLELVDHQILLFYCSYQSLISILIITTLQPPPHLVRFPN